MMVIVLALALCLVPVAASAQIFPGWPNVWPSGGGGGAAGCPNGTAGAVQTTDGTACVGGASLAFLGNGVYTQGSVTWDATWGLEVDNDSASSINIDISTSVPGSSDIAHYTSRGTLASPAAVQNGDQLGAFTFHGYDGVSSFPISSQIIGLVSGTVGASQVPGEIDFKVADAAGTLAVRALITSNANKDSIFDVTATTSGAQAGLGVLSTAGNAFGLIQSSSNGKDATLTVSQQGASGTRNANFAVQTLNGFSGIFVPEIGSAITATPIYFVNGGDLVFKFGANSVASSTERVRIKANAGEVIIQNLAGTGAATGKTIVCADTNGQLYRSSSADTCAN